MVLEDGLRAESILLFTARGCVQCKCLILDCSSSFFIVYRIETKYIDAFDKGDERYTMSPKDLLVDAVNINDEIGSCTCVVITMDPSQPVLSSCNLGDSGYMILRKDKDD